MPDDGDPPQYFYVRVKKDGHIACCPIWQCGSASGNRVKIPEIPATDIDFPKNNMPRLLTIGTVKPSDQKHGQLMLIDAQPILKICNAPFSSLQMI